MPYSHKFLFVKYTGPRRCTECLQKKASTEYLSKTCPLCKNCFTRIGRIKRQLGDSRYGTRN